MTESGTTAFLQQAYRNNWQRYLASLASRTGGNWDMCVLTASNEQQAHMYRRQLTLRDEAGLLPQGTAFEVISDPDGQRIGSGGATLRVLAMLAAANKLQDRRVLIVHSGGDSRRLPHCSATGKLFARIPRALPDGRASTLFDEFLISLSGVATGAPPGVLIASGDVLLVFDHLQLDLHRPGVTGVAIAAPAETGTHHGVYVLNNGHRGMRPLRLNAFLHKPSLEQLQKWDAIADDGTVPVDTGLVWLDAPTAHRFIALTQQTAVSAFCGTSASAPSTIKTGLNLYGDLLMPLVASTTYEAYLADTSDGPATPALQAARQIVWQQLRGISLAVEKLQPAVFAHFGTSREYWELVVASPEWARNWGWTRCTSSWQTVPLDTSADEATLMNAILDKDISGTRALGLVVDSHLAGPLSLQGAALIAGLEATQSLTLRADVVIHQLPVDGGYVTRVFGLYDDPKQPRDDPSASIINRPWADWLRALGADPQIIWPGIGFDEQTLWNARLYPLSPDRETSLRLAVVLQDPENAPPGWHERWLASERLSLAESFSRADGEGILREAIAIHDQVAASRFYHAIKNEHPASDSKSFLGSVSQIVERRASWVARKIEQEDASAQIRLYKALAEATGDSTWEDRAFAALAGMIAKSINSQRSTLSVGQSSASCEITRVEAAARIDFGGGWTDTPPYSIERGGTVLNAAIIFDRYPIVVQVERLPEPKLILESADIDARIEPTTAQILAFANPADPFALLKAAVVLRGIVPADVDPNAPIAAALQDRGGLLLHTQTTIPRGSGLGTSSILAGAVLACLSCWLGVKQTQAQLFDDVLYLEQMLTTGGGWQDQVGGLTGGIKLATTDPGLPQRIQVEPVRLPAQTQAELDERLMLVYTGQQRLAKNLLRAVMGRWMARDAEMVWIQGEIARLAVAMQGALRAGDISTFGVLLGEHWALNKRMDPGCTNPFIDRLFEVMAPYINGGKLAGAGGGGFAIVVARDADAAQLLRDVLARRYPGTQVAVWPCAIPEEGMIVTA